MKPLGLLAALTLLVFSDALFSGRPVFLSTEYGDLGAQFIDWRSFGFAELRQGRLPLWNPHLYSGAPFFGGFQSALLYPLNALFLVLPIAQAVNWTIALHVFLAGAFTYAWTATRGLLPPACVLAAAIFMFGGAHVSHVSAGHLSNLSTLIWAPLLFLAIDGLFERPSLGWTLLGMFAVSMAVLAGHPQYVFYLAVAAGIYSLACATRAPQRLKFLGGLGAIVAGGAALSAIQLFTGLQESSEMARRTVSYEFAARFSFPPENLLTLFAPTILGTPETYWGRWYPWEVSLFIGATGLVLAAIGAVACERAHRRFAITMTAALLLLALGAYTPVFKVLYDWVPGFSQFRGTAKFTVFASLFLAMAAAHGMDALLRGRPLPRSVPGGVAAAALLSLIAAFVAHNAGASDWWRATLLAMRSTGEIVFKSAASYDNPVFAADAADGAAQAFLIAGVILAALSILLASLHRRQAARWLVLSLAVGELVVFARMGVRTAELARPEVARVKDVVDTHPGDFRILNLIYPNAALSMPANDIWGYDPGVFTRYAQLVAASQGMAPERADQDVPFTRDHPLLDMLRLRFIMSVRNHNFTVSERASYLPHALLVPGFRVLTDRDDRLSALSAPSFDPRTEVILEEMPEPRPVPSDNPGTARVIAASSDTLTIEADARSASILLVTDAYARGWRAEPLPDSSQRSYRVLPANHGLRGIPLAAGRHVLQLEYLPTGFVAGRVISLAAVAIFIALLAFRILRGVFRWRLPR